MILYHISRRNGNRCCAFPATSPILPSRAARAADGCAVHMVPPFFCGHAAIPDVLACQQQKKLPSIKGQEFRDSHPISPPRRRGRPLRVCDSPRIGRRREGLLTFSLPCSGMHFVTPAASLLTWRDSLRRLRNEYSILSQHVCRIFTHYTMRRRGRQWVSAFLRKRNKENGKKENGTREAAPSHGAKPCQKSNGHLRGNRALPGKGFCHSSMK